MQPLWCFDLYRNIKLLIKLLVSAKSLVWVTCLSRDSIFDLHKWHLCLIAQRWVCTTESFRRVVHSGRVNVDWIYTGMLEIGVVVSSILFGILTMQIYFYHKNFSEDPPWIKLGLVDGIWFIELIHTVCIAHEVYEPITQIL
ncbi:MAG: hypothetical protein NXY57DRAFT_1011630 [Lentinula lateritia]|uniref:Uncharacterized protein n=1 Tax=Lentinula lateritia TaxID=40482 RepID=A0ABQ8VI09_9AGAR|nr:MAG: hypothetical protein NXY57DRAFT_1011630 [Lentinula lateritia]KAJ4493403.1 hypothetical protein C8R41DRAFT_830998 [Lentinula lateritia]